MKKYGVREVRPTITDLGTTDDLPKGCTKDVRKGYLTFCRHHPGFDDAALRRAAQRGALKRKKEARV